MKKTKSEKFLNLYKEIINSTNYNKILDNINNYSKLKIEKIYEKLKNKVSKLKNFFENEKENITKENLIKIYKEIEKQELYFDKVNYFLTLENLQYLKKIKKTKLIKIIELIIYDLIIDFEYLIKYWNEENQIDINYLNLKI